jgi:CheY-like chemotaxis protein
MSRILLVDDSPHAQRMGERILTAEGYEVVTLSDADSAIIRLEDVDPDVIVADAVMPGRTGYEICQYVKMNPRHRHVRVILTAGVLDLFDEESLRRAAPDSTLKKPFEATALLAAVKPLAEAAVAERHQARGTVPQDAGRPISEVPFVTVVDSEQIRAAVTVAMDASMEAITSEITRRVLAALQEGRSAATQEPLESTVPEYLQAAASAPAAAPAPVPVPVPVAVEAAPRQAPAPSQPETPVVAAAAAPAALPEKKPSAPVPSEVRRITPVKRRSGPFLSLGLNTPFEPESGPPPDEN